MKISKKRLETAAKDLNRVMGLDPPIDTDVEEKELMDKMVEASSLVAADDKLVEDTWKVLKEIGDYLINNEQNKQAKEGESKMEEISNIEVQEVKKKKSYTRLDAIVEVFNSGHRNKKDLVKKANELYIQNGGKDNIFIMNDIASNCLTFLERISSQDKEG